MNQKSRRVGYGKEQGERNSRTLREFLLRRR